MTTNDQTKVDDEVQKKAALIERLKASKENCKKDEREHGWHRGKAWATHKAEYSDLVRAAAVNEETYPDDLVQGDPASWLFFTLYPDDCQRGLDADEFSSLFDDTRPEQVTPHFVCGFLEGAAEVFAQVETDL